MSGFNSNYTKPTHKAATKSSSNLLEFGDIKAYIQHLQQMDRNKKNNPKHRRPSLKHIKPIQLLKPTNLLPLFKLIKLIKVPLTILP